MTYDNTNRGAYQPPNSNLALISLIAGILGLTFFPFVGSIIALIVGFMAKKEIQESNGALGGEGLMKAGLILGWIGVGLGVIGLCIGGVLIALPLCSIPLILFSENFSSFHILMVSLV